MAEKTGRNRTIEIMKAISIMGIVLLHAVFIQLGYNDSLCNILRLVAIKTLLVLSGFVVYGKITQKNWILEKIVRRLPILIVFTFIYWLFGTYVVGVDGVGRFDVSPVAFYLYNIAIGFGGLVLWYIWVLILCYFIIWVFEKYIAVVLKKVPYLLKFALLVFSITFIPLDAFGLNYLRWYGLFMFVGYAIRYIYEKYPKWRKYGSKLIISTIALFPLFGYIWWGVISYSGQWVNSGYVNLVKSFGSGESYYAIIYAVLALLGVAFVYTIANLLVKIKYINQVLIFIGSSTIGILLIHKPFLELKMFDNYILTFVVALIISVSIYQLLKRVKMLDYLLFGGTDIPIKLSRKLGGWYAKVQA